MIGKSSIIFLAVFVSVLGGCRVSFTCVYTGFRSAHERFSDTATVTSNCAFGDPNLKATIPLMLPSMGSLRLGAKESKEYLDFVIQLRTMLLGTGIDRDQSFRLQRLRNLEYKAVDLFSRVPIQLAFSTASAVFRHKRFQLCCSCHNRQYGNIQNSFIYTSNCEPLSFYFSPLKLYYEMKWRSSEAPLSLVPIERSTIQDVDFGPWLDVLPVEIFEQILFECFLSNANFYNMSSLNKSFRAINPTEVVFQIASSREIAFYIQKNLSTAFDHSYWCPIVHYAISRSGVFALIPDAKYPTVVHTLARPRNCGITPLLTMYDPRNGHLHGLLEYFLNASDDTLKLCVNCASLVMRTAMRIDESRFLVTLNMIFTSTLLWKKIVQDKAMLEATMKIIKQALWMRALRKSVADRMFSVPFDASYREHLPLFKIT